MSHKSPTFQGSQKIDHFNLWEALRKNGEPEYGKQISSEEGLICQALQPIPLAKNCANAGPDLDGWRRCETVKEDSGKRTVP